MDAPLNGVATRRKDVVLASSIVEEREGESFCNYSSGLRSRCMTYGCGGDLIIVYILQ